MGSRTDEDRSPLQPPAAGQYTAHHIPFMGPGLINAMLATTSSITGPQTGLQGTLCRAFQLKYPMVSAVNQPVGFGIIQRYPVVIQRRHYGNGSHGISYWDMVRRTAGPV